MKKKPANISIKKAKNWEFINLESSHTGNVEVYEAKVGILSDFFHQVF